jgi:hypothetical protein
MVGEGPPSTPSIGRAKGMDAHHRWPSDLGIAVVMVAAPRS